MGMVGLSLISTPRSTPTTCAITAPGPRTGDRNGMAQKTDMPQKAWKTSGQWFNGICQEIADAGIVDDTNHDAALTV